jgi:hypothetical protein
MTMDLVNDLFRKTKMMDAAIKRLANEGQKLAESERNYKIALRQEVLKLRELGMAVGIIDKIVYGVPDIADLRFNRDVAETLYKTALEYLNTLKLEIRVIQSQVDKEWSHSDT